MTLKIPFLIMSEFSKVLEKSDIEENYVYFSYNGNLKDFSMFCGSDNKFVVYSHKINSESSDNLSAGIDRKTFLSVSKLFKKGDVELSIAKDNFIIVNNNSESKFPINARVRRFTIPNAAIVSGGLKDWLAEGFSNVYSSISTAIGNRSFPGILLDVSSNVCRICKFSETALFINSGKVVHPMKGSKIVFPDVFANLCKALQKSLEIIFFGSSWLGLGFKNGVEFYCLAEDNGYPEEYLNYLGINDSEDLVEEKDLAEFDKKDLISVVKLISASLGDAEFWIKFNKLENEKWEVSGRSYTGFEIKETIDCTGNLNIDSFGVNKKKLLKALSIFDEKVYFKNMRNSIGLFNKERSKAVFLTKAD